jgi:hypothetical protein
LCAACQTRREHWLTWERGNRPATNFSGWLELPAGEQSCVRLGGGWATRAADGEVLQPVVCWLELSLRRDREIQVAALTVPLRRGRLRWREIVLRAPQGRPTAELDYQLAQAAREFASAAVKYRQRLARADADQLQRWLIEATPPAAEVSAAQAPTPAAAAIHAPAAAEAAAATALMPASPALPVQTPLPAPRRTRQRIAAWFDRLAHAAADWLDAEPES